MGFKDTTNKLFWLKEKSRIRHEIQWNLLSEDMLANIASQLSSMDKISTYALRALIDIHYSHPDDFVEQTRIYFDKTSSFEHRTIARFGQDHWNNKIAAVAASAPGKSRFTIKYWTDKGYSDDDARLQISKIQSDNGKKAWQKDRSCVVSNAYTIKYWTDKGYSDDEARALIERYTFNNSGSLARYIEKYGHAVGKIKHAARYAQAAETRRAKHGSSCLPGKASKESLKLFIPLYKKLRKLGIDISDICWGIDGSREFVTQSANRVFFYDFTIKSLKIVIEFHGTFWHPRLPEEWKNNHFYDYDSKKLYDEIKKNAIIDKGFEYIVVWSDENIKQSIDAIVTRVKDKLNDYERL